MPKPCYQWQMKKLKTKVPFDNQERASIWRAMRIGYTDHGVPFHDIFDTNGHLVEKGAVSRIAEDLGIDPEFIVQAITGDKSMRNVTQDLLQKSYARRVHMAHARQLMAEANKPGWAKALTDFYDAPRSALIAFHSFTFPWTHAGQSLLTPTEWGLAMRAYMNAVSFGRPTKGGIAAYESAMQEMERGKYFDLARLVTRTLDPGWTPSGIFGKYFGGSRRGIDATKIMRSKMFEQEAERWGLDKLPFQQRLEAARFLMAPIEHATGVYTQSGSIFNRNWMSRIFFAPQLLPARWAASIGDPARAIGTYARWRTASVGERAAARFVAKRTAQTLVTSATILGLNEAINHMVGSGDHVNFSDPKRSDWLRLKIAGYSIPLSFQYEPIRLAIQMLASGAHPRRGESFQSAFGRPLLQYGFGHFHPTIGRSIEAISGRQQVTERPLPFKELSPAFTPRKREREPVSLGEYAFSLGPIPFGEGAREFYQLLRDEGMDHNSTKILMQSLAFGVLGTLGPKPYPAKQIGTIQQPRTAMDVPSPTQRKLISAP